MKRSRNWSSRKRGVRGTRSTRASVPGSVRCPESISRKLPLGLQDTAPANELARKVTWRRSPPAEGTRNALVNPLAPVSRKAIHLPSGDQANPRGEVNGWRSRTPVATTRSFRPSRSTTRSSCPLRTKATCFPSGENFGVASLSG